SRRDRLRSLPDGGERLDDRDPAGPRAAPRGARVPRLPQLSHAGAVGPGRSAVGADPSPQGPRGAGGGAMSYAALAGLFLLIPSAVFVLAVARRRPGRRWWASTAVTIAVLLVLTAVFDTA